MKVYYVDDPSCPDSFCALEPPVMVTAGDVKSQTTIFAYATQIMLSNVIYRVLCYSYLWDVLALI